MVRGEIVAFFAVLTLSGCGRIGYERVIEVPVEGAPTNPDRDGQPGDPLPVPSEPCVEYPFGDGLDGDVEIPADFETSINLAQRVTDPLPAGTVNIDAILPLSLAPFRPGSVVMFWQTQLPAALPRGLELPFDLGAEPSLGRYELARVAQVDANALTLCAPLTFEYVEGAQYVHIPQFRSVTVNVGARGDTHCGDLS